MVDVEPVTAVLVPVLVLVLELVLVEVLLPDPPPPQAKIATPSIKVNSMPIYVFTLFFIKTPMLNPNLQAGFTTMPSSYFRFIAMTMPHIK